MILPLLPPPEKTIFWFQCSGGADSNLIDLLDRLLIVRTLPYSEEEMVQIIKLRASTEGLTIDEAAVTVLGQIGSNATLRYAIQVGSKIAER